MTQSLEGDSVIHLAPSEIGWRRPKNLLHDLEFEIGLIEGFLFGGLSTRNKKNRPFSVSSATPR
jgi:hypothetical protein